MTSVAKVDYKRDAAFINGTNSDWTDIPGSATLSLYKKNAYKEYLNIGKICV